MGVVLALHEVLGYGLLDLLFEVGHGLVEQLLHFGVDYVCMVMSEFILCLLKQFYVEFSFIKALDRVPHTLKLFVIALKFEVGTFYAVLLAKLRHRIRGLPPPFEVVVHPVVPEVLHHLPLHVHFPPLDLAIPLQDQPYRPESVDLSLANDLDMECLVDSLPFCAGYVGYLLHLWELDLADVDELVAFFIEQPDFLLDFLETVELFLFHVQVQVFEVVFADVDVTELEIC